MHRLNKKAYKMLSVSFTHCKMEEKNKRLVLKKFQWKLYILVSLKCFFLKLIKTLGMNITKKMLTLVNVQRAMVWCLVFLTSILFALFPEHHPTYKSILWQFEGTEEVHLDETVMILIVNTPYIYDSRWFSQRS